MNSNSNLEMPSKDLEMLTRFISHDLRSPLRSIIGFSGLILENQTSRLDETSVSNIHRIVKAAQRMQLLIEGMLSYTRIGQKTLNISTLNIFKICSEIVAKKTPENHHHEISISHNLEARGDETLITVLFENLIDNALKSIDGSKPGKIIIDSVTTPQGPAFRLADNGEGFDMKYSQNLFEPFELLNPGQKKNGIGMGLAIAKKIVERHNGSIWFTSELNVGTTFYFTLNLD